jgi:proteasome accessory factor B
VAGYTGSPETMERMFERDKDELRELGIEIEVGGLDPLFEDDQGYLIRSESFQLDSNQFENEELLYLTMAVNLWHDSALQANSKAALLKIQSLSGPIESNSVNLPVIRDAENSKTLATAFESVEKRFVLNFQYKGSERSVQPYGLYTQDGFWYLVANEADAIKSFKLQRIEGELKKVGKESSFTKPSEFDLATFLTSTRSAKKEIAVLRVRKNQGHALRSKYAVTEIDDEWDQMNLEYGFDQEIIQTILWYGSNVLVEKPAKLRTDIKSRLKELISG